jgi:ribosomal protein L11 methyltransferase
LVFADDLCICPSWCEPPPRMRRVLRIDPGRAFGTGTHATTALCLDWLARAPDIVGRHVIDYGCGSGILALAACACGAAPIEAIDIDCDALAVAADNARSNGMAADISFATERAARIAPCDILIANILLEPLLNLAPLFASLVRPGGRIALSGLLNTQVAQVLDAYTAAFTMLDTHTREDWVLLIGVRT